MPVLRDDCIIVLYMNDCCIFSHNIAIIDVLIATLRSAHLLELSDPAPIKDFLGIHIKKQSDGMIHLTQHGLITSILQDLNFHEKEVKPKYIPASQILHADLMGQDRKDRWNYPSIIGKLNFLAQKHSPRYSICHAPMCSVL